MFIILSANVIKLAIAGNKSYKDNTMIKDIIMFLLLLVVFMACCGTVQATEKIPQTKSENTQNQSSAPKVLSIIPAQAEPGKSVTVFGGNFGEGITVFLGTVGIEAKITGGKKLEFTIPLQLDPGIYALNLKRSDGVIGRAYNFQVLPLRPVLTGLSPDTIESCMQGEQREVIATGRNFSEQSMLLFDGAVIKSRLLSPESIAFSVPQVGGGLHKVLVKNPPDISSTPYTITVETKPEISQVTMGKEHVNYYELIITGKNFQQNSSIYVDGQRIGGRGQEFTQREKLIYIDCNTLIYQRHPYSPVSKELRIQVINQGGDGSQLINVTAP